METILLVDDEPEQLKSLRIGLLSNGYNTLEALGGQAALNLFDDPRTRIDMVITDYSMPGMDGIRLINKVREKSGSLPVLMMTAYGEKGLVIEALRNQCDSYIEKPFSLKELIIEIERIKRQMVPANSFHNLKKVLPRLVHQINNPLMAISANVEMGIFDLSDQKILKKSFSSIIEATKKIQAINNQILKLDLSHEEVRSKINIVRVLNDALAMFDSLIALKKIVIEKEIECENIYVLGSRNNLEQAIKNIIMNAIDAMDGKTIRMLKVKVSMHRQNASVLIRLEDTGCGIPEDILQKIFDPYFTRKENGNGLGLTVVNEAIESLHGKIKVESQIDRGTCFEIELPMDSDNSVKRIHCA